MKTKEIKPCNEPEFKEELTKLINRFSIKLGIEVPDYALSEYLITCLHTFNQYVILRKMHKYGNCTHGSQ